MVKGPELSTAARDAIASVARRAKGGAVVPDSARVVLHFHPDNDILGGAVLRGILEHGRYVSQFVTRTSNGGLTAHPSGDRWRWESRIFSGAYDDASDELRPVYGALRVDADEYGAAPRFGSAYLRLRPETLARTTFAYPDSFFQPALFGVQDRLGLIEYFAAASVDDPLDHYIEAHVHGGVRVPDDAEAVVVDPSFDDDAALRLAEQCGLTVERHTGYLATAEQIGEHPAYRGRDVAELASAVADGGVLTPAMIGRARVREDLDQQRLKRLWHCLARYGRSWPSDVH
ncbi:DUF3626 domain-containing protein [Rathayibacter sp. CAU 1779]